MNIGQNITKLCTQLAIVTQSSNIIVSLNVKLPAELASSIFLLRRFQLLIFSSVIGILQARRGTDIKCKWEIQAFVLIWLSSKNKRKGCLNIEIQRP